MCKDRHRAHQPTQVRVSTLRLNKTMASRTQRVRITGGVAVAKVKPVVAAAEATLTSTLDGASKVRLLDWVSLVLDGWLIPLSQTLINDCAISNDARFFHLSICYTFIGRSIRQAERAGVYHSIIPDIGPGSFIFHLFITSP